MEASTEYKRFYYIDYNLVSGSQDNIRNTFGTAWSSISGAAEGIELTFYPKAGDIPESWANGYLSTYECNTDLKEQISSDVFTYNYKFPFRIYGDPATVVDDAFWRNLILAGTGAAGPINSVGTFDDYAFKLCLPYTAIEEKSLSEQADYTISTTYSYNYYWREYEARLRQLNEVAYPNVYVLQAYMDDYIATGGTEFDLELASLISLEGAIDFSGMFDSMDTSLLPPSMLDSAVEAMTTPGVYKDRTYNIRNYLTSSWASYDYTVDQLEQFTTLRNIMFDQDFDLGSDLGALLQPATSVADTVNKMPFYTTISWNPTAKLTQPSNPFIRDAIVLNNYSSKFLVSLKEIFAEQTAISLEQFVYGTVEEYYVEENVLYATTENNFKGMMFTNFLGYCYNNPIPLINDVWFCGNLTGSRVSALDTRGTYRYENSAKAASTMTYIYDQISGSGQWTFEGQDALLTMLNQANIEPALAAAYSSPASSGLAEDIPARHTEVLAYSIRKFAGDSIGAMGEELQTAWIFNSTAVSELTEIAYHDTQVQYGMPYTYAVNAYVAVIGNRYKIGDPVISEHVSALTSSSGEEYVCLQFKDTAGDSADQLLETSASNPILDPTSEFYNPYANNSVIVTSASYVADFELEYEACVSLVEVPIVAKTVRVLDHPNAVPLISPFQVMDDSQRIGFNLGDRSTEPSTFPLTLNTPEARLKTMYLSSNELLETESLIKDSVSKVSEFQIFRLGSKPKAISDFGNQLYASVPLVYNGSSDIIFPQYYTTAQFVDRVSTNHTYYYLIRSVNEHNIPGYVDCVYTARLVNDGGYKYAIFDILHEADLSEELYINPVSRGFKNMIELIPAGSQLSVDDSQVDYSLPAESQLSQLSLGSIDESIWDRKFKLRLTSKKTDRKIDLNITYKLENG